MGELMKTYRFAGSSYEAYLAWIRDTCAQHAATLPTEHAGGFLAVSREQPANAIRKRIEKLAAHLGKVYPNGHQAEHLIDLTYFLRSKLIWNGARRMGILRTTIDL